MEWFGILPKRWETHRLKNLFTLRDERNFLPLSEVNLLSLYTAIGVKPHSQIERVAGNVAVTADNYKKVYRNDVIVNIILCWQGAVGVSKWDGVTSPAYDVYRATSDNINVDYYHYLFRIPLFSGECYKSGHGIMAMRWRTYSDEFGAITIPFPPRSEQDQIVRFLDWKVSQINKLINAKRRQIALLDEQKQAVINQTVTTVGNSWRTTALKRLLITQMSDGPHETPEFYDEGIPFVSAEASHDGRIFLSDCRGYISRDQHETYCKKVRPQRNDIFIVKSGSTTGKVVMVDIDDEFSIWSPLALVRCKSDYDCRYVFYFLNSTKFQKAVQDNWSFGTQPNIGMGILRNLPIDYPPLQKQHEIAFALDKLCGGIDNVISAINAEIALQHEYRTCLISDIVTGKLDVRGVNVPEYEVITDHADDILLEDEEIAGDDEE